MQVSPLRYHITQGKIGINYYQPIGQIKQKDADLEIKKTEAEVRIQTKPSRLSIDQTEAFAQVGLKSPIRQENDWIRDMISEWSENVAKTARQGDQLMRIENNPTGMLSQIAKNNAHEPMKEMNIGFLPSSHFDVKIDYEPAEVKIDVRKNDPTINVKINKPEIKHEVWRAETYLLQKPNLDIEYIGKHMNKNF